MAESGSSLRNHPRSRGSAYASAMPPAIVVPGSTIARTRERLVREAERVAERIGAELVVLSGRDEAEHMRSLWDGSAVHADDPSS